MVALCGLVGNYSQLLFVRMGVAVGEAGCVPPAQSLISDYFQRAERPRAMAIYWMCYPISVIIGYLGGGWLAEHIGWRLTFVVIGVPGILLAILVRFTMHEPRLKQQNLLVVEQPSFKTVLKTLGSKYSFRHVVMAFCVAYFFGMGVAIWVPAFFIRSHGMSIGELGAWLAFVWGACGLLGNHLGGVLTARYAAGKEALQMRFVALMMVLTGILYVLVYLSPNKYIAMAFLAVIGVVSTLGNGPVFSAIQSLVDSRMRSVALALILLFANLIGFGLGPISIGIISDLLEPVFGQDSLRYALVLFCPGTLWVAVHYWKAANAIEAEIFDVESAENSMSTKSSALESESIGNQILTDGQSS